jgi:hypothetical protein
MWPKKKTVDLDPFGHSYVKAFKCKLILFAVYAQAGEMGHVVCKVCPKLRDTILTMRQCHIAAHDRTKKHRRNLSHALCHSHATPPPSFESNIDFDMLEPSNLTLHDEPSWGQPPSDPMSENATPPLTNTINDDAEDDESYFPIEELCHATASARTFLHADYYEEMQAALQRGESLFSCPLPPSSDELGMETDDVDLDNGLELDNHGIDLSGMYSLFYIHTYHY